MKEQFLKRKLNPFLLISTVLVLAILAGSSVFYQTELSDLVSTRNQLQEDLKEKNQTLANTMEMNQNLNETIREFERNIRQKESKINEQNQRITVLERELDQAENQNQETQERISELESKADNLNNSLYIVCTSNSTLSDSARFNCERQGYGR